ncbi:MAG: hypothetical protein AAFX44_12310 [Pseudomonadota bacterium]
MTFCVFARSSGHRFAQFAALLVLLGACSDGSLTPEASIRAWVAESEALAEEKAFRKLAGRVAEHYEDARGNDKARIIAQLRAMTLGQARMEAVTSIDSIELFGDDAARVTLTLRFASVESELRGFDVGTYLVQLELAQVSDDWQVYAARWGRNERDMR